MQSLNAQNKLNRLMEEPFAQVGFLGYVGVSMDR